MSDNLAKILCVDDENDVLESLRRTLRKKFDVVLYENPKKALESLQEEGDFAIVISDHYMAEMTGIEFLAQCKKYSPNTSRILLSGEINLKNMEEAINNANVHKFIMKPWNNDSLLVHVMEAFKHHKTLLEKDKFKQLSITDPITQLTNHRFFQEKIRIEWDKHTKNKDQLSLILIDIDHFKRFNDQYGHPEGDKILTLVASRMQSDLPIGMSLSRYGGEEFAVILPNTVTEGARQIAENLRQSVAQASFDGYPLSVSLGVSTAPKFANSVDELIIGADQALYQAKRLGRNQTVVGLPLEF